MNQILNVEPLNKKPNKKNSGPLEIKLIIKFFAISILILGLIFVAIAGYEIYKDKVLNKIPTKPTIYVEDTSATEIDIQVSHDKALSKVTYQWNNEDIVDMKAEGKKKIEELIKIPNGTNELKINAIDVNGEEIKYNKKYTVLGDISIEITTENTSIKVIAEGKEKLAYMTYRWDEEEEKKIEINDIEKEQLIEIPEGLHKLTVVVVDVNNKTETKVQDVKGVTKPKVTMSTDGKENFIIKASDNEGIARIEFTLNNGEKEVKDITNELPIEERKEYECKYPMVDGENKLKVEVFNESGVSTVKGGKVVK